MPFSPILQMKIARSIDLWLSKSHEMRVTGISCFSCTELRYVLPSKPRFFSHFQGPTHSFHAVLQSLAEILGPAFPLPQILLAFFICLVLDFKDKVSAYKDPPRKEKKDKIF